VKIELLTQVLDHLLEVSLGPATYRDSGAGVKTDYRLVNPREELIAKWSLILGMVESGLSRVHSGQIQRTPQVAPVYHFVLLRPGADSRVREKKIAAAPWETVAASRPDEPHQEMIPGIVSDGYCRIETLATKPTYEQKQLKPVPFPQIVLTAICRPRGVVSDETDSRERGSKEWSRVRLADERHRKS
jgi:hypothetical protein